MPHSQSSLSLANEKVREVYDGAEGDLFSLVMGEQIHLGGLTASLALAQAAGIQGGCGVDLCCCNGAGMRFLVRHKAVDHMIGVELAQKVIDQGLEFNRLDGTEKQIEFLQADACASNLDNESVDFIWSEDAWCYVPNKALLISEAVRIVKRGGIIAFSDWVEGEKGLGDDERALLFGAMKFESLETLDGYKSLLELHGCEVTLAEDTGIYASQMHLLAEILDKQLRWDALRLLSFNEPILDFMIEGFRTMSEWGSQQKISQVRMIACRN